MEPDTATFEVRHRGRTVATFTGSRATARGEAEARCREFGPGRLAWVKEVDPERTTKRVLNTLWTIGAIFFGIIMFWLEL